MDARYLGSANASCRHLWETDGRFIKASTRLPSYGHGDFDGRINISMTILDFLARSIRGYPSALVGSS